MGAKSVGSAVVDGVLEYLPKGVRKGVKALDYFRIKDKSS